MSAATRVTYRSISDAALRGLQANLANTQQLQEQLSSGRRVSQPSDDPSATGASMQLRSQRRADEQYLRNIEDATGRLNVTDGALTQISDRIQRAQALLTQSRDGALDSNGQAAIAAELTSIRDEVIGQYNTRWLDRPIFGGTVQGSNAIDPNTGTYLGNDAPILARITRDSTLRVDTQGISAGADTLPGVLAQAATDVASNPSAVASDLDALGTELSKVLTSLGDVGARAARLDTTKTNVDSERLDFTSRISENEDVDLPQTIMNFQSQQVAYQSALGAASKVLQTSLMDFLK